MQDCVQALCLQSAPDLSVRFEALQSKLQGAAAQISEAKSAILSQKQMLLDCSRKKDSLQLLAETQAVDIETLKAKCAALEQDRVLAADEALANRGSLIAECSIAI